MFHLQLFVTEPGCAAEPIIAYLDFETTGLSVARDHIVEIWLLEHGSAAAFSTVVCPPTLPSVGPSVHGLSDEELERGPNFRVAYHRMVAFLDGFVNRAVDDSMYVCMKTNERSSI